MSFGIIVLVEGNNGPQMSKRTLAKVHSSSISRHQYAQQVHSQSPQSDKGSPKFNQPNDLLGNLRAVGFRKMNPYEAVLEIEGRPVQMR